MTLCENCHQRPATQWHEKFAQKAKNIQHYGKDLIYARFNSMMVCSRCNVSHAHMKPENIWDERTFREQAYLAGHVLPPPMKSYKKETQ